MKSFAFFVLPALFLAATASTIGDDDSSCTGTVCTADGDTLTFSIELIVGNPDYPQLNFQTIPITSVAFYNPLVKACIRDEYLLTFASIKTILDNIIV